MGKEIFCRFPCKNDDLTIHLGYAILDAGVGINFIDHFNARELILKFFHGNDESLVVLGFLYSNLKNRTALQMTGMSYLSRRGLNYKAFDTLFSVQSVFVARFRGAIAGVCIVGALCRREEHMG